MDRCLFFFVDDLDLLAGVFTSCGVFGAGVSTASGALTALAGGSTPSTLRLSDKNAEQYLTC